MRSVVFHFVDVTHQQIADMLSTLADRDGTRDWRFPRGSSHPILYIGFYEDLLVEFEQDELAALKFSLGKLPDVSVIADISGRVPGDREVRELVDFLLLKFKGVVMDDYTYHGWTLEEIRSGQKIEGHLFFDCEGWYSAKQATGITMTRLPPIDHLISRCKALAALELILSPEWQYRYFSFNASWSADEQMASMRDGCGDEWWIVFHRSGWAGLKGLGHDSPAWSRHGKTLSAALQTSLPRELKEFSNEPAFRWDETSFAYFYLPGDALWTRANDLAGYSTDAGDAKLLSQLVGESKDYARFAADYYETDVDERIVEDVFALRPITNSMVRTLNASIGLEDIATELYQEIQYPSAGAA